MDPSSCHPSPRLGFNSCGSYPTPPGTIYQLRHLSRPPGIFYQLRHLSRDLLRAAAFISIPRDLLPAAACQPHPIRCDIRSAPVRSPPCLNTCKPIACHPLASFRFCCLAAAGPWAAENRATPNDTTKSNIKWSWPCPSEDQATPDDTTNKIFFFFFFFFSSSSSCSASPSYHSSSSSFLLLLFLLLLFFFFFFSFFFFSFSTAGMKPRVGRNNTTRVIEASTCHGSRVGGKFIDRNFLPMQLGWWRQRRLCEP